MKVLDWEVEESWGEASFKKTDAKKENPGWSIFFGRKTLDLVTMELKRDNSICAGHR